MKTKNFPNIYQELVQAWADVSEKEPSNPLEVCSECLWNNRLITSNGESLYNRHFIAKGIIRVQDIVNQNGLLLLWSDAQEKYSLNNSLILNWQGLIKNIPKKWKTMLSSDHIEFLATEGNGPTANKMSVTAGIAYQKLLNTIVKPPTAQRSLNNLLRINSVDWTKVYMLQRQVTIELSLCSFQYKILNNFLYLNEKLFKCKIVASPLCSLCKLHSESIIYLLSTCRVTLTLWNQLCLDIGNWHSSTRIHGPTDNHIRSMERKDTRLCNHQSHYIIIQTLYLSKGAG